jgi:hypothetical protein
MLSGLGIGIPPLPEALNDFFLNQTGQPRPVLKQNQFGFALGGPIKKEKVLFFSSYRTFLPAQQGSCHSSVAARLGWRCKG